MSKTGNNETQKLTLKWPLCRYLNLFGSLCFAAFDQRPLKSELIMQDLISNEQKTMSSREIAELTGKQLSHVHRDFKVMADDLGFPAESLISKRLMPSPNMDLGFCYDLDDQKRIKCIHLNQELTLTLVSGYSAKLRNAIIKRRQDLEEEKQFKIPQTLPEALQLAADQAKQLEEQAPKIEVYELLADRKACMSTTEAAKSMGISSQKLNKWLKVNGYKFMHRDLPTVKNPEWFNVVDGVNEHSGKEYQQCLITPKGQIEIAKRYNK